MEAVRGEEFLRWVTSKSIGVDPRYPNSGCLGFLPPPHHTRFWCLPVDVGTWPYFVATFLGGLDEWAGGWLWPRSGNWPASERSQSHNERILDVVLRGVGIPDGWAGAVRFERDEIDSVLAVLFVTLAFGWCSDDDLLFVPDHARQLLWTDHHDVVHVECVSGERVLELVAYLATKGYELLTEPPDWTFIRPAWMSRGEPI